MHSPMPYPAQELYETLYARYLQGTRTEELLALAGDLAGKQVVDLCGGSGRLSLSALTQRAEVTLVDESVAMLNGLSAPALRTVKRPVEQWLESFMDNEAYDAMFCQQAVNYWLTPDMAPLVAQGLRPGGKFIFNTFNRRPGTTPVPKTYSLGSVNFVELSWFVPDGTRETFPGTPAAPWHTDVLNGSIEHVQIREGFAPHTTRFRWISPLQFQKWLSPWFELQELVDGPATVWVCTRK